MADPAIPDRLATAIGRRAHWARIAVT